MSDAGRESIVLFGVNLAARLVGFLGLVYFARVLPPSELGIYFLFFLLVQVATLVSGLGLGPAIIQRVSATDRPSAMFSAAVAVILAASTAATALFFLLRGQIAAYVGADVPILLSLAVAAWLLADIHIRALQGEDRVVTGGLLQLLQDVLRVGTGAALISAGYGAVGLIYGVLLGFLATTVAGYVLTDLHLVVPRREDFGTLFAISRYTMFIGPTNFVYFWFDTFMIGLLLTRADVSAYEVAWQTIRVLIIPTNAIQQTIFPKVSRWASEGETGEIERILPGAIIFTLAIPVPGLVGLAVLGPEILSLVYRPAYIEAALPMAILGGFMLAESVHRVGSVVLMGMDRADVPFRTRIAGVILAVILNVALIPPFGLVGAAVATVAAKLVDAAWLWHSLVGIVHVDPPVRSVSWLLGSAAVMGLGVVAVRRYVAVRGLFELLALVGFAVLVYGFLLLVDGEVRQVIEQYLPVGR